MSSRCIASMVMHVTAFTLNIPSPHQTTGAFNQTSNQSITQSIKQPIKQLINQAVCRSMLAYRSSFSGCGVCSWHQGRCLCHLAAGGGSEPAARAQGWQPGPPLLLALHLAAPGCASSSPALYGVRSPCLGLGGQPVLAAFTASLLPMHTKSTIGNMSCPPQTIAARSRYTHNAFYFVAASKPFAYSASHYILSQQFCNLSANTHYAFWSMCHVGRRIFRWH